MARLIDNTVGHASVWRQLLQQLHNGRLPHAMAFAGPSGIGKKRVAWALAQALVCEGAQPPCGQCPPCRRVENQQSEGVLFLEPEGTQIKLEATQQVLSFLVMARLGRARVVILDQAQSLNPQAANALLKAIEEPPPQTYFILLVNEVSQLLATLRSRVQVVRFSPLTAAQLQAQVGDAAEWMVHSARGSFAQLEVFRDAECEELRTVTLNFLRGAFSRQREGLSALLDQTKERLAAQRSVQFLQQLLRDWSVLNTDRLIHSDLKAQLSQLPNVAAEERVQLWRSAFQMEMDLLAHVDRSLIFENFYYRAQGLSS